MTVYRQLTIAFFLLSVFQACKETKKEKLFQPTVNNRYDVAHPAVISLPESLSEISGIAYYPKDTSVFAIVDEDGILFKISLNRKGDVKKWKFDKKRDFEDVVLHDSVFYVLVSNGDIESIRFTNGDSLISSLSQFENADKKENEFESLIYDDSLHQLVLFCKSCSEDDHKTVSAWAYDFNSMIYTAAVYHIDISPIARQMGMEKIRLKPSAVAVNPLTNEFYILASVNKLLVVVNRQGGFVRLYQLDPALYKQPEGIAFTPAADLIISNESHETGAATLLIIKNQLK